MCFCTEDGEAKEKNHQIIGEEKERVRETADCKEETKKKKKQNHRKICRKSANKVKTSMQMSPDIIASKEERGK